MKGCLIALAVVLLIIVLIVVGLGVYFFAFEKDVPDFVIDYIKEAFSGLSEAEINRSFETVNNFGNVDCELQLSAQQGDITDSKRYVVSRKGKDDTFVLDLAIYNANSSTAENTYKFFIEEGKYKITQNGVTNETTKEEWEDNVVYAFEFALPLVVSEDGTKYKIKGSEYLEKNLVSIRQKGFKATVFAKNNEDTYTLGIDYMKGVLSDYEIVEHKVEGGIATTYTYKYLITLDMSQLK